MHSKCIIETVINFSPSILRAYLLSENCTAARKDKYLIRRFAGNCFSCRANKSATWIYESVARFTTERKVSESGTLMCSMSI